MPQLLQEEGVTKATASFQCNCSPRRSQSWTGRRATAFPLEKTRSRQRAAYSCQLIAHLQLRSPQHRLLVSLPLVGPTLWLLSVTWCYLASAVSSSRQIEAVALNALLRVDWSCLGSRPSQLLLSLGNLPSLYARFSAPRTLLLELVVSPPPES